jgi:hypothetical protein
MQGRMLLLLFSVLATSLCAFGDPTDLEFQIAGSGGSYNYNFSTGYDLVGTGIEVTEVQGQGTPDNVGVTEAIYSAPGVLGGNLSFTSGSSTGVWTWGSGGTLTVTGCVQGVTGTGAGGACQAGDYSNVLVSDAFTSVQLVPVGNGQGFQFGGLTGDINPTLAAFYGVSTTFVSTSTESDMVAGLPTIWSTFSGATSTGSGGNLSLDTSPSPAPEPGTAALWLTGIGLLIVTRKRIARLVRLGEGAHFSPSLPVIH